MARSSTTFGPGNRAAVKHGGKAQVTGASATLETGPNGFGDEARASYPWLVDHPELEARYVTTKAQIDQLRAFIEEHGSLDTRGKPRPAVTLLRNREKDMASCLKLIESLRPGVRDVEPWQLAQLRLRMRYLGEDQEAKLERYQAEHVRLTGSRYEVPPLEPVLAPDGKPYPPLPWPPGYLEEQNRLWRLQHQTELAAMRRTP